jgi:hypothetical protein
MLFKKKPKADLYEYRGYTIGEVKLGPTKRYAVYYNQGMREFVLPPKKRTRKLIYQLQVMNSAPARKVFI